MEVKKKELIERSRKYILPKERAEKSVHLQPYKNNKWRFGKIIDWSGKDEYIMKIEPAETKWMVFSVPIKESDNPDNIKMFGLNLNLKIQDHSQKIIHGIITNEEYGLITFDPDITLIK